MSISGFIIISVIDDYRVPKSLLPAGFNDTAVPGYVNRGSHIGRKVHSLMEFCGLVDRIYSITIPRCCSFQIFVRNGLYGRNVFYALLLALCQFDEFVHGIALYIYLPRKVVYFLAGGNNQLCIAHLQQILVPAGIVYSVIPDFVVYRLGLQNDPIHVVVSLL